MHSQAYVPGYDYDVFISYAHIDNQPLSIGGNDIGWVTFLKQQLQKFVDQELGRKDAAKIWMDLGDLCGYDTVLPTLEGAIHKTATFVVVLSTGYLTSEWCQKELQEFIRATKDDSRIFVIHLSDIPLDERPEQIRDLNGFSFFDYELKAMLDPEQIEYRHELLGLRAQIARKLVEMSEGEDGTRRRTNVAPQRNRRDDTSHNLPAEPADIFLSYARKDQEKARQLAASLTSHGWSVWWDRKIPPGSTFDQMIQQALETSRCVLVLWSSASVTSNWVKEEATEAQQMDKLVPALIEDVQIPLGFRRIQAANLTQWRLNTIDEHFSELLGSITARLGAPVVNSRQQVDPPVERRIPLVWESEGRKRVLDPGLHTQDQILLLVYSCPSGATLDDLLKWTKCPDIVHFERLLNEQDRNCFIDYSPETKVVRILPKGEKYVEGRWINQL